MLLASLSNLKAILTISYNWFNSLKKRMWLSSRILIAEEIFWDKKENVELVNCINNNNFPAYTIMSYL